MIRISNLNDGSTTTTVASGGSQAPKGKSYLLKQPIQDTVQFCGGASKPVEAVETLSSKFFKIDYADIPSEKRPLTIYEKPYSLAEEEPVKQEIKPPAIILDEKTEKLNLKLQTLMAQRKKAQVDYDHLKEYSYTKKVEIIAAKFKLDALEKRVSTLQGKLLEKVAALADKAPKA